MTQSELELFNCCLYGKSHNYLHTRVKSSEAIIKLYKKHAPNSRVTFKGSLRRAFFIPILNKVFVYNVRTCIEELAHAKQYEDLGVLKFLIFFAKSWLMSPFFNAKQQAAQYKLKGTLEYEAHKVVSPKLWKEFYELVK